MELLLQILAAKRPYGDPYEKSFVQKVIIERLEAKGHHVIRTGPMENLVVIVPVNEAGDVNKVLFSCHTDTVHSVGGPNKVVVDEHLGVAYTDDKGHDCLGADDGTGVWMLLEMIDAKIPGTYVFHRGEERGCIGSGWMAKDKATQEFLRKYDYAIAFDRRDHTDVITHQRGRRCCSEEFAKAFAEALNVHDKTFAYKPDPTGIYTDTANYDELIKECTNISVGYSGAHGAGEMQDLEHAKKLLDACKKIEWAKLPAVREAKRETYGYSNSHHNSHRGRSQQDNFGATGRSTTGYTAGQSSSSSISPSLHASMKQLAQHYIEQEGKNAMIAAMQRMFKDPPLSLKEMLQSSIDGPEGTEGTNDYLMALVKYMPEMAVVALRQALVYFQYYQLSLSKEGKRDSGLLGFSPTRSTYLENAFEAGAFGILFDKKAVVPPYRPEKTEKTEKPDPERDKVVQLRKQRKELKKAKKMAKKGKLKGRQFVSGDTPGSIRELKSTKDPVDPPRTNIIPISAAGSDHFPTAKNVTQ